jgi:DNA-directed RNA polymerase
MLYLNNLNILRMAELFRNKEFYLPVYLDYRGRIYNYCHTLTYQNMYLARALLNFSTGGELNKDNFNYLILYATNLFGFSKQSNTIKDTWFDTHKNYIDSFKSNKHEDWDWNFLNTSDEPFQAIAICKLLTQ